MKTTNTGLPKPVPTAWQGPIGAYLAQQRAAGRPRQTIATRKYHLARFARAMRCAPAEVSGDRVVAWFERQHQWAAETRRSYRTTLRSFFAWALEEGVVELNPAVALLPVRAAKRTPRPTPDMAWRVALAAADRRTTLMLRLAGEAGLRRAEIAVAHTRDLAESADGPELLVHGKGNKERIVPLSEELAALVRAGAAGHTCGCTQRGFLFPGEDNGHLSPRRVGELLRDALPDHWTAHTLRHRFATRAYRGTRNIRAVQQLLGHQSVATTEIYTGVDVGEMRAAVLAASEPLSD
ncbi:tyrosine-type recombinase/integrase [Mycobacterium sp. 141]|uniref:tyrosine-type recombinase/integrase n=1 Tax=Mycobacterium sp. 141 TaxID=1120797 RepID=UPI0003824907|nr:tyrosine-type recombinase/integrase [Mycobacterium sp. 141]